LTLVITSRASGVSIQSLTCGAIPPDCFVAGLLAMTALESRRRCWFGMIPAAQSGVCYGWRADIADCPPPRPLGGHPRRSRCLDAVLL